MTDAKFYDSHCHIMNLSHPNLLAFIQKLNLPFILLFAPLFPFLFKEKLCRVKNLLSVMENDLGTMLLMIEHFLVEDQSLWEKGSLKIGGNLYSKIVLTPLLMDFGYKGRSDPEIYYNLPSQKPITDQVCDLFNGIKKYVKESKYRLFEIYPFLGLNTQNYYMDKETAIKVSQKPDLKQLPKDLRSMVIYNKTSGKLTFFGKMAEAERESLAGLFNNERDRRAIRLLYEKSQQLRKRTTLPKLLDKYFADYHGIQEELAANQGRFTGNIDRMGGNFFAGIKVYPPLGFDPWPEDDEIELAKVEYLYQYCSEKRIPITTHCGSGGFVVIDRKLSKTYCSPDKWEQVLQSYPELILNLAHFGYGYKKFGFFPADEWTGKIIKLIGKYDYLFTDFAFNGKDVNYYKDLRKIIDRTPAKLREKLKSRILFGSDFMINLTGVESYNKYLEIFSGSLDLSEEEKERFCTVNAERFLFGEKTVKLEKGNDEVVGG